MLHAATAGGRELNGMGDASAPTHGALADLLILDKNPLEDIDSLKNPAGVLTFGRLVKDWRLA